MNVKMLSPEEQSILDNFHLKLEKIEEYIPLVSSGIPDWDKASYDLRLKIHIDSNALCKLEPDFIQQKFNDSKDFVKAYLNERILTTNNNLLKGKYNHFLYCLTKNNQYGKQAIEEYQKTLLLYLASPNQEKIYLNFEDILSITINLTKSIKYKTEEVKNQVHGYLTDQNVYDRIKTSVIKLLSENTLFKVEEIGYIPELCCDLAKKESKHRFIEINLQLGLKIARKLKNTEIQRTIYKLLGDNEYKNIKYYDGKPESLLIPHQNRSTYIKIILYYKNAHNKKKCDKAILEHNANKINCKFLKIKGFNKNENVEERQKVLEELFLSIVSSSTREICNQLISGDKLPFISDIYLNKYAEENKNNIINESFNPISIDINNNGKNEDKEGHLKSKYYLLNLSLPIYFAFDVITEGFATKKLSYNKILKVLCSNSFFGKELKFVRDEQELTYTWFSTIDIGLKSFCEQYSLLLKNKQPDWRISIDFLSLKFEGILRDIVDLSGGVITEVDIYGNATDKLLDDLLVSSSIIDVFSKDDINLFHYTFTSRGYNIRNDVAHSFYKPQDYNWFKALLVFLCILRLAKFNYIKCKEQKRNEIK